MKVSEHIAYGGAASVALAPVFGFQTLYFFFGSLFIDLDHYVDFLYYGKFKNWSIPKMFKFHGVFALSSPTEPILALEAFHTVEFFLAWLTTAFIFQSQELYLVFGGMVFHLFLDLLRLYQKRKIHFRALSFIEYWVRSKRMVAYKGFHPEKIFWQAYETLI